MNPLLNHFYKSQPQLNINLQEIKEINNFYKMNYNDYNNIEELQKHHPEIYSLIARAGESALLEISKQLKNAKALQPGIITECVYLDSLAKFLGLNNCVASDNLTSLATTFDIGNTARFIYFNENNNSTIYLIQYGDPLSIDAKLFYQGEFYNIEVKEPKAKSNEIDIPSYTDEGYLLTDDRFINMYSDYVPLIDLFNQETNMLRMIGHNYPLVNNQQNIFLLNKYVERKNIDYVLSADNDNLLLIRGSDIGSFFSTIGSEIRTAGKNSKKYFTPVLLKQVLSKKSISEDNDLYTLPLDSVSLTTGRGQQNITRIKINNFFFLKIEDCAYNNDVVVFNIKNIKQLKPTLSVHMSLNTNFNNLFQHYLEVLND